MGDMSLTREEVRAVIEGRGRARRVPLMYHFWIDSHAYTGKNRSFVEDMLEKYPYDLQILKINPAGYFDAPEDEPEYRWLHYENPNKNAGPHGIDNSCALPDWSLLDDIIRQAPDPCSKHLLGDHKPPDGRYRLGHWWFCFFEKFWCFRGMSNALTDFYLYPDKVHRLFRALTEFYKVMIRRARDEYRLDGIFTSDDIGTQSGPFFSKEVFQEFFKPYYRELFATAHENGMHFWLHTCGDVMPFLDDFCEIGLDVIHPIQKYAMCEKDVADKYGDKICIWAGFDVQQILPVGTPDDVRNEVRNMVDTYDRKEGRFMLTMGNGVTADCPVRNLGVLFDESVHYPASRN